MTSTKRQVLRLIAEYNDGHSGHAADLCEIILLTHQSARTMRRNAHELVRDGLMEQAGWMRYRVTDAGKQALGEADCAR